MTTPLYPVFLKLRERPVLFAGGGSVAERRVERLLEAGARLTLVSPELTPRLAALERRGKFAWIARRLQIEDLEPGSLEPGAIVMVATGDRALAEMLRSRSDPGLAGPLLNVADDESLSDFHVPATAARGQVRIAVSTGGESPRAAAVLSRELQRWLDANEPLVAEAMAQRRGLGTAARPETHAAGREAGRVALVGAGPGDPGLLTIRARDLLAGADIVYYDRLVSDAIVSTIPPPVELVYVGKEVGCATRANVEELLVESARAGKRVVRLKGGDPLIFGRGGEEILALERAGIDYEVVPGVSALTAVPGAAGIPLTHRGVASEIVVRSGHRVSPERAVETTYVYFMAATRLPRIVEELRAEGLPDSTPVAIVQRGTLPEQKVLVSELGSLLDATAREAVETPALIVAGDMVKFRDLREFSLLLERAAVNQGAAEPWDP
jgi:uroporphyrin-III C-methyltransferase/precorrin-2 dehydrogenase/sirohydrochlorin ferrochelatase